MKIFGLTLLIMCIAIVACVLTKEKINSSQENLVEKAAVAAADESQGDIAEATPNEIESVEGDVDMESDFSMDLVEKIVVRQYSQIGKCVQPDYDMDFKVTAKWTINENGKVTNLVLDSKRSRDKVVLNCIKRKLLVMNFPQLRSGEFLDVAYPFNFIVINRNRYIY